MDAAEFFGLEPTEEPLHWRLPVVPRLCSGIGALFGGIGLGASIEIVEHTLERPIVWATAQYLSFARPGAVVDLEVTEAARGHHVSQVRVVGHVGDEEIFTVNAAAGRRPDEAVGAWAGRQDVPPPEDCPPRRIPREQRGMLADHLDMRLANARPPEDLPGPPGGGRSALWVRLPDVPVGAATLAVFGDYVPFGISQTLGQRIGGNSLDNTLRVAARSDPQWVLADVRVHAVAHGFAHGLVHLWGADGRLLGTASQSTIVRAWKDQPRS